MTKDPVIKHYLIFERSAHSVLSFVRAETPTEAMQIFIRQNNEADILPDGSVIEEWDTEQGNLIIKHPHVLAFIEKNYKRNDEWQIREMPDWAFEDQIAEAFVGENINCVDGIYECTARFQKDTGLKNAKAFLWRLKKGALVTFYMTNEEYEMQILKRYFTDWDGRTLTVEPWEGSYEDIVNQLQLLPIRL